MSKHFYTDIDLRLNQLLSALLEHVDPTTITAGSGGRVFWSNTDSAPAYWDGTQTRLFAYKGQTIDPSNVSEDTTHQWVTEQNIINWNQVLADSINYESKPYKDVANGYAGLDSNAKLKMSALWDGMVVEHPASSGTYKTLGQLLGIPNGISTLDENGKLNPSIINQTGFASDVEVLFCSQDEKDGWDALSGGLTGVEVVAHKNIAGGYAGLDANKILNKDQMPEGVVIRSLKKYQVVFSGNIVENEIISFTLDAEPTKYYPAPVNPVLSVMINTIATDLNAYANLSVQHTATTITITSNTNGNDFNLNFSYDNHVTGTLLIDNELVSSAFYDWSNMAGQKDIGFAPLNHFGVIEDTYLPSYKDIRIVDDITALNAINDQYNGLRVHVVDATGDNTVDDGWAEYLWYEDDSTWHKTTERESSIDISHDSMSNVQGDGALLDPQQTNHITDSQYQQLKDSEYMITLNHLDARPGVIMRIFTKSAFRGAKITFTLEDHAGRGIFMEDLNILFDGNYPTMLEFGEVSSAMNNPVTFGLEHDINNIYLKVNSNSDDTSLRLRVREFTKLDDIMPPLTPAIDMYPSSGLLPHN